MRFLLLLAALCLGGVALANTPLPQIEQAISDELPASGAPGIAYTAVRDGEFFSGARGEALAGSGRAITPDTPVLLGSISKSFTAVAVMQLAESGDVDLDDPVSRYLQAFARGPGRDVTLRQLLSHTSGYSTGQGNQVRRDALRTTDEVRQYVEGIAQWELAHQPGTQWEYSNANYQILGALVEEVSGMDYAAYVEGRILAPLGMTSSFVSDGGVYPDMATGHRPWFFGKRAMPENRTDLFNAAAGGVVASANDLALYLAAMMNGQDDIISGQSKSLMMEPASDNSPFYGLGWFLDTEQGTAFHTGSTPGVETLATLLPESREAAVVLVNAGSGIGFGETRQLRNAVSAAALGLPYFGESSRIQQKALYVGLCLMPLAFLLSIWWALRHRSQLRAKSGAFGMFSLWFPLAMMAAITALYLILLPRLFDVSLGTLASFQPDLALLMQAAIITGLGWAILRLILAYTKPKTG